MTDPTGSLDRDLATHFFDGLLEGLGIVLGHAFFDHLGSSFDQSFGKMECKDLYVYDASTI